MEEKWSVSTEPLTDLSRDIEIERSTDAWVVTITFVQMHFSVNKDCLKQKNCSQLCRQTEGGAVCFCKPGYSLDSDGISCNGKCRYIII